ncbi:hypothetical protein Tsp_09437 [Trichinella spiralis]|uniref:hypothetical protein n=1 Tax=Trichinella spiralis TaxID=6334 RepID=UPI0001EFD359|nr:hypothetical protein Tsp_09437 [Trichinella spiralis]
MNELTRDLLHCSMRSAWLAVDDEAVGDPLADSDEPSSASGAKRLSTSKSLFFRVDSFPFGFVGVADSEANFGSTELLLAVAGDGHKLSSSESSPSPILVKPMCFLTFLCALLRLKSPRLKSSTFAG